VSRTLVDEAAGSVTVTETALAQLVAHAVESVEGARLRKGRRRLALEIQAGHVRADLELAVAYGRTLPEVARAVQARVGEALAGMCGLVVDAVDVSVEELDR
jgi:uncharacterized alkaline shock family protein YloU